MFAQDPGRLLAWLSAARRRGERLLAVLIDPDKGHGMPWSEDNAQNGAEHQTQPAIAAAAEAGVDLFLVGGSLVMADALAATIASIRRLSPTTPIVLFPGSIAQVHPSADALLFLSLISGRNAEMLIGNHVLAAPMVRASGLEVLPTGYMLVDGGRPTTVSYISNTQPLPNDKPDIAAATAMAGEMLGLKLLYLDAGSGAANSVPTSIIKAVASVTESPLVVGGGIRTAAAAEAAWEAGATVVVIGNALEKSPELVSEFARARA